MIISWVCCDKLVKVLIVGSKNWLKISSSAPNW